MHFGIRIIVSIAAGATFVTCFMIFMYVQLNEWRLEARLLIVRHLNALGRTRLDDIERQFAQKLISKASNDPNIDQDDLDQIFIDYLADRDFLKNFFVQLQREADENQGAFRICRRRLAETEKIVMNWAEGGLSQRLPAKYFDDRLRRNWKVRILLTTLPHFFEKRALNFWIELKKAVSAVSPAAV
jgi:hypothetical protein